MSKQSSTHSQDRRSIDQAFKDIDKQFEKVQNKNKYLKYALLTPIHDKYPYAQNGITAMIASMGSGKTYTYLKLMKQQEVLFDDAFYELIVLCSTSNKFDATVNAFKGLITKSKLVAIKDTDLLEFLNKYMRRILKFNALNKYMVNNKDVDEELERLCNKHQLKLDSTKPKDVEKVVRYICNKIEKYQWRTFPHRCLLVLDDFASHPLLRSKENELPRLLKKLRHFNINVIICVQTTRSIPRDIKRILSDCILFPGISRDDYYDLMKEGPFGEFDADETYKAYKSMTNKHDRMVFHIAANRIIIHKADK
ncbi:MAG: hypothetical protein J6R47_02345 [Acholeplasmatales bacterium]|nr:hypothetical protein [Acholeplasmatales bacterium]